MQNPSNLDGFILNAEQDQMATVGGDLAAREEIVSETKRVWLFLNF
jgi:hypothetical protein